VERLRSCPGRIGTQLLIDAATIISSDVYEDWRIRQSQGHGDSLRPPDLPAITRCWVQRWRRAYGVTFRTVNLRYKISHSKRMLRLRICWSNVLRLRLLHECLYGSDGVDLVSVDQKPLYFNSSLACKTLAPRGARKVNVKESVADSIERFTIMTSCPSWRVTRAPGLAILFRHSDAEASRVTRSVSARKHSLVQWAPKGSYRLHHVLEYLSWAIRQEHAVPDRPGTGAWPATETTQARARGEAADQDEARDDASGTSRDAVEAQAGALVACGMPAETRQLVVVLDWFAPHLDARVDEQLKGSGVACLRIAGGLTPDVQVCDTHRHGPLTACYRNLESRDSQRQLKLCPSKMPSFSRQQVFDRSLQAWAQTSTGVDGRLEWVQNACLNALDGSEDGLIARDLLPLWLQLGMPNIREQLRDEISR